MEAVENAVLSEEIECAEDSSAADTFSGLLQLAQQLVSGERSTALLRDLDDPASGAGESMTAFAERAKCSLD
jgi:hypothetical protein